MKVHPTSLIAFAMLLASPVFAQATKAKAQNVPEIPYESVPNFLKLPTNLYLGESMGVATNSKGHVFVFTRSANTRLFEFDQNGTYVREIGEGSYGFEFAHSVRVDPEGNIWAVDACNHMVYKMDPQGKVIMRLGQKGVSGMGSNNFYLPTDVAFAANGDIYVSDGYGNPRVVKFTRAGKYLLQFGKRGTGPGEFGLPHNVVVDARGRVYVTDRDHQRVEVFDSNGEFLHQWKTYGGVSTLFMTKDQHIWVGGFLQDLDGKVLGRLPFPPDGDGGVHGTTVTDSGDVYLAYLSGQVQKFVKTTASAGQ